ncbi:UV DNA damage repair endonuclease UvsE [bacterium]|nr:UV DNA damage repair endonuclease UvsE [bacterium]
MTTRFGYACINSTLQKSKPNRIFCSRGMIKRTFKARGIEYASQLGLQNTLDLIKIVAWNNEQGIKVFRVTSCLFPWHSEYDLVDLPDYEGIKANLEFAGKLARDNNQRLSTHPGQFNVLTSKNERVIQNAVDELDKHGIIFDIMGMPRSPAAKINIHIGGAYGDRKSAIERWCKNYELLSDSAKSRLTVENDDKPALYSSKMLYDNIVKRTGTPIVFDSHHFECGPQDSSYEEAFLMAVDSWPDDIRPQCHHSNSRKIYEDPKSRVNQHSDWYYKPFNDCGVSVDVVLECKQKELALFKYLKDFGL